MFTHENQAQNQTVKTQNQAFQAQNQDFQAQNRVFQDHNRAFLPQKDLEKLDFELLLGLKSLILSYCWA